jgi:hypothetical protein
VSYTTPDPERVAKDLCIVFRCDRFADTKPIEALRELKRARGETRV